MKRDHDDYLDRWNEPSRPVHETYEEKLDRWKEGWNRELDEDLEQGR